MDVETIIDDNSEEVLQKMDAAILKALERMGEQAEGYAVDLVPVGTPESTGIDGYRGGALKENITHIVEAENKKVYIGTNIEYGPYVELGTGIYAEEGGRPTPWVWQDFNGDWHHTRGQEPQPYLRPAVKDHAQTYRNILEEELKNG